MTDRERRLVIALTRLTDAQRLMATSGLDDVLPDGTARLVRASATLGVLVERLRRELREGEGRSGG